MLHGLEQIESITIIFIKEKGKKPRDYSFYFIHIQMIIFLTALIGEFNCTFTEWIKSGSLPESSVLKFIELKNWQNFQPAYY